MWITTLRQGDERDDRRVGIVVAWPGNRRGPLGDVEATLTSLAGDLDVDALLLLASQPGVGTVWPTVRPIKRASPRALRRLAHPAGAMTPTIETACRFVTATGRRAAIGRLEQLGQLLAGTAGTQVVADAATELGEPYAVGDRAS